MTANAPTFIAAARHWDILPSAARTATPNDTILEGLPAADSNGLVIFLNLSAFTTAASLTVNVLGVDKVSGQQWVIATTGALTALGTYALCIHPNNPTQAMTAGVQKAQGQIPDVIQIQVVHGNGNSHTYSVGAHFTG